MSQENYSIFSLNPIVQANKYIVYNRQRFPIDFDLIKTFSLYFKKNQNDFENKTDIEIAEEENISNDIFQVFINCCQKEQIKITDSNVFALHYLSIKYEVPGLRNFTENYIEENHQKLIFQSLLFKQKSQESTKFQFKSDQLQILNASKEEEIISNHLNEYISDERLLSLQIPVIYRILDIYFQKNKSKNDQIEKKKIADFLINYLKHHGKKASIIFNIVDFGNVNNELIIRLHNECKEIFDFNMINPESLFNTTYDLLSEIRSIKFEMIKITQEYKEQLKLLNEYKASTVSQINQFNEEAKRLKHNQDNLESQQKSMEEKQLNIENKQKSMEEKQLNIESQQKSMEVKQQIIFQLSNRQDEFSRQLIQQQQQQKSFQESLDKIIEQNSVFATREILI